MTFEILSFNESLVKNCSPIKRRIEFQNIIQNKKFDPAIFIEEI